MTAKAPTAPVSAPVDPGADEEALALGIEAIRENLRKAGTVLGSAATAVLGGLGWATLHNLFPAPAGKEGLYLLAAVAAALAAGGAAVLAFRFFVGQKRVLLTARIPSFDERGKYGFGKEDLEIIERVFDAHASDESATDLHTLEMRALRLERVARAKGETADGAIAKEAERLHDVVRIALARAAAGVVEHRAQDAVAGSTTKWALACAVVGIGLLWGAADYSQGQRDLIDLRKKCAEAVKVGASTACDPVVSEDKQSKEAQAKKQEAAKKALQRRNTKAAQATELTKLESELGSAGAATLALAQRCAEVVGIRLAGQPEAVRVAAVKACSAAR
jgi:hypothetical protein